MGLDKLLVMVDSGEEYQVLDLYKYVYKCGYVECSMLFFSVHDASKAEFVRKIDRWTLRDPCWVWLLPLSYCLCLSVRTR